jgi:DNA repair exonuclease SbcCD ATPase subunit
MPPAQETTAADELFRLPLSEFTAARNALAAKLKKEGDPEESDRIKALSKPPVSAWVANQLYWKHRIAFDRLLAAGDQFRKAQAAQLAGKSVDLRGALDARRETLGEMTKLATEVLRQAGHPAAPDMMRRIMTTLEAIATYGDHPGGPPLGRLTADVDPPGFEALAALVPAGGTHQRSGTARGHVAPRVIPFNQPKPQRTARKAADDREDSRRAEQERREQQNEARKALREAERALAEARRDAERARAEMKEAAARAKTAEKEKAALEARFEKLSAAAEAARQAARQVASRAEAAAQAVDDAERAVTAAREGLKALE